MPLRKGALSFRSWPPCYRDGCRSEGGGVSRPLCEDARLSGNCSPNSLVIWRVSASWFFCHKDFTTSWLS